MTFDALLGWITGVGAVGTAAMGFVEGLKLFQVGDWGVATAGLRKVRRHLGTEAMAALRGVYGPEGDRALIEGSWRRGDRDLEQTLRNGLRIAVFSDRPDAAGFVAAFGQDPPEIRAAVARLRKGTAAAGDPLDPEVARERVARLEAAIDARVQGAVAAGKDFYVAWNQFLASLFSVGGCLVVSWSRVLETEAGEGRTVLPLGTALLVGILAVPVAPVAKDAVGFLTSVRGAFQKRQAGA